MTSSAYIIYGITDCPACLRACALLMEKDIEYAFVETDFSSSYRASLKKKYNWTTFPIIVKLFLRDEREEIVGGYDDLLYTLSDESSPT